MWFTPRDHKIVGETLAAAREKARITQIELAKRLKKPQSFVSAYESGQRRLDLLELVKIIGAIGADARGLISGLVNRIARGQRTERR